MDLPRTPILLRDEHLVAANKPAGVTVIPARDEPPALALRQRLEAQLGRPLWVVHRIDRDTSGVVLFACSAEAHRALSMAFEAHAVRKTYAAWVLGEATPDEGVITTPLHTARKGKMRPAQPGESDALPSETAYAVTGRFETSLGVVSRVSFVPRSGRQHQIRVHARSVGAPLLVDPLYAPRSSVERGALGADSPAITRLTLHASTLAFDHPITHAPMRVDAPLAPDLEALDTWLTLPRG